MKSLSHIWPWVKPYKWYAVAAIAGAFVSVGINLAIPLQTARIIDEGIRTGDWPLVRSTVTTMVVLILAGMAFSVFTAAMAVRLAFHATTDLRRDLYGAAQGFSFGNLDHLSSGELLTRLTSDISKVTMVLTVGLSFMAQTPIMFIGALVAILAIDPSLTVVIAVMVPSIGLIVWYTLSRSTTLFDAVQTRLDRLNTVLGENIAGTEVIKAFVRQDHEAKRFDQVSDDLADRATTVNQLVAALMPTLIALSSLGVAAVVWLGGNGVINGSLSEGDLVAFISYMAMVAMPMMIFAFMQPMLSAAGASLSRINQVLEVTPLVEDPENGVDLGQQTRPGDIEFDNVSFHYESADTDGERADALCEITLRISQGTTVAVLGATGSGKSTLVHLITRFYDPTEGVVRLGGVDVRQLSIETLRANVAIALQEPELFSGTVMENLRYGRTDASDDEIVSAAKAAQAHDFISGMTLGYDSVLEQGGSNLSGGQRQRLAIARTLVVNPAILILDDSTSAVDLETEARIQDALAAFSQQTVVLVAQRISTALGADEIIVLDDGRVCAHGSHSELMRTSEVYQEIFQSQLGAAAASEANS